MVSSSSSSTCDANTVSPLRTSNDDEFLELLRLCSTTKPCWHSPLHRASSVGDPSCALIAPSVWVGRPPNGCCRLWLHRHGSSHLNGHDHADRAAVASDCYSFANRAYGVLGRQAIACIDEFELTTSVAAAIHLQQGTTCLSSNFTFILDSSFLFVLQNFNLLDKTLLDLGSTNWKKYNDFQATVFQKLKKVNFNPKLINCCNNKFYLLRDSNTLAIECW